VAYSAYKWQQFLKWLPLKYSNVFRVNVAARAVQSVGRGAVVAVLVSGDVAMFEALMDEYAAFDAGNCD
jgi:precorrin-4 methylase